MYTPLEVPTEQEGLVLRQLTVEDASAYFEAVNANRGHLSQFDDSTATKYPDLESVVESLTHPKNPDKIRMGIWLGDTIVGSINLTPDEDGEAVKLGYWLDAHATGNGYATAATRAISAAINTSYPKVYAEVIEDNHKSASVLERSGFNITARRAGKLIFELLDTAASPEKCELNPLTHPIGYFDAQVRFALKWAQVSGEDFNSVLLEKTAIHRRIFNQAQPKNGNMSEWSGLLEGLDEYTDHDAISSVLFEAYEGKPHSKYDATPRQSAFGHDYLPDSRAAKIHFTNPVRGENPFSEKNMPIRREEFKQMIKSIMTEHPDTTTLISASWLRSTSSYRSLSPPDIAEQQDLMSPNMSFSGDSVWGQFIDRNGNLNQRVYDQFVAALSSAGTIDELLAAFPYKTIMAKDPIDKYLQHYGIDRDPASSGK